MAKKKRPSEEPPAPERPADFSDPESQRVLDATAKALIAPLAIQAAREDHAKWLASRAAAVPTSDPDKEPNA